MSTGPPVPDLSLRHLQAELACLDVRLRREVRRWQLAGQDPNDSYRGLYVSDAEAEALLARPLATSWGGSQSLSPEEAQASAEAARRAAQACDAITQEAGRSGQPLRLRRLASVFGLDRFDLDILLVALAPVLDLRYEKLYAYLQDDVTRKRPTINLALDLLAEPGPDRLAHWPRFADDAPLFRYHLLERTPETAKLPLLSQVLVPDPAVAAWLLGRYQPHADLGAHAQLLRPQADEDSAVLTAEVWPHLALALDDDGILALHGPDRAAQEAVLRRLAARRRRAAFPSARAGVHGDCADLRREVREKRRIPFAGKRTDACFDPKRPEKPAPLRP